MRDDVDDGEDGAPALTQHEQSESEQDREEEYLQDLALREGAYHGVGDDVHQEFDRALLPGLRRIDLNRFGIDRSGVHVHADAGLKDVYHDQADDQGEAGDELEIEQRFHTDAADLLHILHAGDTVHDGTEDDRRDEHLDQLDERRQAASWPRRAAGKNDPIGYRVRSR